MSKYEYKYIRVDFFCEYEYEYIWIQFFRQIQVRIYSGYQRWANMNTNMNIWTVICEYKYEYEYLSHTKPKINMLLYKKAVKVRKKIFLYVP